MKTIKLIMIILAMAAVASCDFLEPEADNSRGQDVMDEAIEIV